MASLRAKDFTKTFGIDYQEFSTGDKDQLNSDSASSCSQVKLAST